jgi:hypothetical protein
MTVLVGLLCQDGAVIGSDSSATFCQGARLTIEQRDKKVEIIGGDVIIAATGTMGLSQRFGAIVKSVRASREFDLTQQDPIHVGKIVAINTINDFNSTLVGKGQFGALMAFWSQGNFCLCEFPVNDFQPELKTTTMWYTSMGSGQAITDPFLGLMRRVFWKDTMPTLSDGIFAVTWALEHTIDLNPGGINGPKQIGVLRTAAGGAVEARLLTDDELREHENNVNGAEQHLAQYRVLQSDAGAQPIPMPEPEPAPEPVANAQNA